MSCEAEVKKLYNVLDAVWDANWSVIDPVLKPVAELLGFSDQVVYEGFVQSTSNIPASDLEDIPYSLSQEITRAVLDSSSVTKAMRDRLPSTPQMSMVRAQNYIERNLPGNIPTFNYSYVKRASQDILKTAIASDTGFTVAGIAIQNLQFNNAVPDEIVARTYLINNYNNFTEGSPITVDYYLALCGTTIPWRYESVTNTSGTLDILLENTVDIISLYIDQTSTTEYADSEPNDPSPGDGNPFWEINVTRTYYTMLIDEFGSCTGSLVLDTSVSPNPAVISTTYSNTDPGSSVDPPVEYSRVEDHIEQVHLYTTAVSDIGVWYTVKYTYAGQVYYWYYLSGTGTHTTLDAVSPDDAGTDTSRMLPVLGIKRSDDYLSESIDADEYNHTKQALKYYGLDLDAIIDHIDTNSSTGSTEVPDIFIQFALDIRSDTQEAKKTLYAFADLINNSYSSVTSTEYTTYKTNYIAAEEARADRNDAWDSGGTTECKPPYNYIAVTCDYGIKQGIRYGYSTKTTSNSGLLATPYVITITTASDWNGNPEGYVTLQKQTDFTSGSELYDEIIIFGLQNLFIIDTYHKTSGVPAYITYTVDLDDTQLVDGVSEPIPFIIPMSYTFLLTLTHKERERVIIESIRTTSNAYAYANLSWYQTESFTFYMGEALKIAALVFFVATAGSGKEGSEVLLELAVYVATSAAIKFAFDYYIDNYTDESDVGKRTALRVTQALVTLSFAPDGAVNFDVLAGLEFVKAIQTYYDYDIELTQAELEDLTASQTDLWEELEEIRNTTGLDAAISLFSGYDFINQFNKTPTEWIEGRLTTNLAPIVMSNYHNYHDDMLSLDLPITNADVEYIKYNSSDTQNTARST